MTKRTYDFFRETKDIHLIPTTTRTYVQYTRLSETFAMFGCRYALVCNGGILLKDNTIDEKWIDETKANAGRELRDLSEAEQVLRQMYPEYSIHSVNDIMVYIKTETPASDANKIRKVISPNSINIFFDSRKVYCIPSSINKGNAVKRFSERMGISYSISAGDSISDVSMLNMTNEAILPAELSGFVENRHKFVADNTRYFSDYICDILSQEHVAKTLNN